MKKNKITIGIVGAALNSANLGCQALAYSAVYLLWKIAGKKCDNIKIYLFEANPDNGKCKDLCDKLNIPYSCVSSHKADYIAVFRSYRKFWKTNCATVLRIKECDFIFDLTEGDSFSDIYGDKRFKELTKMKRMIQRLRVPYILGPQTYGPYNSESNRQYAKKILMHTDKIFARDKMSADLVEEMTGKPVDTLADMAFFLPYKKQEAASGDKIRVGLNISGLLTENNYEGTLKCFELKTDYDAYIRAVLKYLCSREQYEVYLIPHVESDYKAIQQLAKEYTGVNTVSPFDNPIDVKSFISSMDIFIGARMHATIAAFTCGVMTIPTAYSRKFKGVFDIVQLDSVVDLLNDDTKTSVDKTIRLINEWTENPDLQYKNYSLCEEEKNKTEQLFEGIIYNFLK